MSCATTQPSRCVFWAALQQKARYNVQRQQPRATTHCTGTYVHASHRHRCDEPALTTLQLDHSAQPHLCDLLWHHAPLVRQLVVPEIQQLEGLVLALEQPIALGVEAADEVVAEVQALQAAVVRQRVQDEIEALLAHVDAGQA